MTNQPLKPRGGTEIMAERIAMVIPQDVAEGVNIVHGDPRNGPIAGMINIFVAHDLPYDKGVYEYLLKTGFNTYDAIVCVSHWQRGLFTSAGFDNNKLYVIENFIEPINIRKSTHNKVGTRFIYTSTPHRGLQELVSAFEELQRSYDDVYLDVYSSFKLYGQPQADEQFKELFNRIDNNPKIVNHGTVSNDMIRRALVNADCFVYPSKWHETSCLCLIEAMSAGIPVIHTPYAALPETSGGLTTLIDYRVGGYEQGEIKGLTSATLKAMKEFMDNRNRYIEEASLARERTNIVYGPKRAITKWVNLINILKENRKTKNGQIRNQNALTFKIR